MSTNIPICYQSWYSQTEFVWRHRAHCEILYQFRQSEINLYLYFYWTFLTQSTTNNFRCTHRSKQQYTPFPRTFGQSDSRKKNFGYSMLKPVFCSSFILIQCAARLLRIPLLFGRYLKNHQRAQKQKGRKEICDSFRPYQVYLNLFQQYPSSSGMRLQTNISKK